MAVKVRDVGERETCGAVPAEIVKVTGLEVPPPGAGLVTVTVAGPAVETAVAGIEAVSCVELMKVVGSAVPLKLTTEVLMKPVPFTVNGKAAEPATVLDGESEVIVGAGLFAAAPSWLMVKISQPAVIVSVRGLPVTFCATA